MDNDADYSDDPDTDTYDAVAVSTHKNKKHSSVLSPTTSTRKPSIDAPHHDEYE